MKRKKIIIISIIINILLIGVFYSFINKDYLHHEKIIVKTMTEGEYENYIETLNQSHTDFANYIQESKSQIASAITDMGVETSNNATLQTMANNIRNISVNNELSAENVVGWNSWYNTSNGNRACYPFINTNDNYIGTTYWNQASTAYGKFYSDYLHLYDNKITALTDITYTEIISDKSGIKINTGELDFGETHDAPDIATSSSDKNYIFIVNSVKDDLKSLVPIMNSADSPSGNVTSSSASSTYKAFYAFSYWKYWMTSGTPAGQWLQYEFPGQKCVKKITFNNHYTDGYAVKDFEFQGSNDGTNWTTLGTFTNPNTLDTISQYTLNNENYYKYYRFSIISAHKSNVIVQGLKLYGY